MKARSTKEQQFISYMKRFSLDQKETEEVIGLRKALIEDSGMNEEAAEGFAIGLLNWRQFWLPFEPSEKEIIKQGLPELLVLEDPEEIAKIRQYFAEHPEELEQLEDLIAQFPNEIKVAVEAIKRILRSTFESQPDYRVKVEVFVQLLFLFCFNYMISRKVIFALIKNRTRGLTEELEKTSTQCKKVEDLFDELIIPQEVWDTWKVFKSDKINMLRKKLQKIKHLGARYVIPPPSQKDKDTHLDYLIFLINRCLRDNFPTSSKAERLVIIGKIFLVLGMQEVECFQKKFSDGTVVQYYPGWNTEEKTLSILQRFLREGPFSQKANLPKDEPGRTKEENREEPDLSGSCETLYFDHKTKTLRCRLLTDSKKSCPKIFDRIRKRTERTELETSVNALFDEFITPYGKALAESQGKEARQ